MKKHVFAVVVGYIYGDIYKKVSESLHLYQPATAPAVDTGVHIYEYSSEGIVNHLVSNYPLPEGSDVGFILSSAAEIDSEQYEQGAEEAGLMMYADPTMTEAYQETPSLLYLGAMLGFNEDGTGVYEE